MEQNILEKMLCLTILVYQYGDEIKYNKGETIYEYNKINDIDILSSLRQSAFKKLLQTVPDGYVYWFLDNKKSSLQVGIVINDQDKRITVVFRGTKCKTDIVYDLQRFKTLLDYGVGVHTGFYRQLQHYDSYDKILDKLKTLWILKPDYETYVTGHSLGGSLSILFSYLLANSIDKKITIYSFGGPKVGNVCFKNQIEYFR